MARAGELVNAAEHPAVLAWEDGELAGVASYIVDGANCELLTLYVSERLVGTGSALLTCVREIALDADCSRLWVVTTNDNLEALRFYQRRGFQLVQVRPGAVDWSREHLKPAISRSGTHGIPLRDELQLEMDLRAT